MVPPVREDASTMRVADSRTDIQPAINGPNGSVLVSELSDDAQKAVLKATDT
jgi:hypothetical protein